MVNSLEKELVMVNELWDLIEATAKDLRWITKLAHALQRDMRVEHEPYWSGMIEHLDTVHQDGSACTHGGTRFG